MAETNMGKYSGVMVFCEQDEGKLVPTDFEMVSEARRLADEIGTHVSCVVIGDQFSGDLRELGGYGADKVYVCSHKSLSDYSTDGYADALCRVVELDKPEILLLCATPIGRDLAPRCAARLGTGLTADCTRLDIDVGKYVQYLREESSLEMDKQTFDYENHDLKMTRPAFGGHLMATIVCPRFRPCMSTVRPGVMRRGAYSAQKAASCQIIRLPNDSFDAAIRTSVVEIVRDAAKKVDFAGAEVIVSVGRGIGKDVAKGLELAQNLAGAFGGAPLGGSRAVIDSGWLPPDHQIGQTGKTVHPRLYVALGISGAMQHLVGMRDSEYILAVNKNSSAPIFALADFAICGDLFKVAPLLAEEIRKITKG